MATTVPFAIRASYQTRHYNAGVPQNPDSVFDALHTPPTTGVAAEAASLAAAQAVGIVRPDANALKGAVAHRDFMRDFYDSASILREEEPASVPPTEPSGPEQPQETGGDVGGNDDPADDVPGDD